ncbi:SpoIIE family protein phosphatase [Amycolatopsis sp., V23-08]|uniref:SpoIIE family protein phosphatase n=1 Tax=Amycolatopsis heterodermiae TaxID=3110235 RepID=A0ABU5RE90_9PSEU|nr:SpoIIE family protein phosphatase [Amycolatopsis sp., V23-08]MEA5363501.1 SpoIIE family protein phosphatase [Amycolatopsis sp., V23-08]
MTEHEDAKATLADPGRLAALAETGLGSQPDAALDALAERTRQRVGTPVALVSLVTDQDQVFPGLAGLGEPWARTRRTPLSASLCRLEVVTGAPLIIEDGGTDPRAWDNRSVADIGIGAYAGFPVTDAAGRVLGSLCVIDHQPRSWREDELAVLAEFAHTCSLELRLRIATRDAHQERARTDTAEAMLRVAFTRSQLLLTASQSLAHADDISQLREIVTDLVSGDLKPAYVGLTLTESGGDLHRIDDPLQALGPESGDAFSHVEDDTPIALTAREGSLQLYPDPEAIAAAFPETAQRRYAELGLHTITCVPLPGPDGVAGVLLFGWDTRHDVDVHEQAVITTLAGYVGHALERARFVEDRVTVARELQEAMLTRLPELTGVRLAARYLPVGRLEQVGGDWYDAIDLNTVDGADRDAVALVVGDITGHDIHAATLMGQVRSMGRQAAWERPTGPPSAILAAVEQACAATGVRATGTVLQAHLRPGDGDRWVMRWASAGHLPPIVRHHDGTTTALTGVDLMFGYPELREVPLTDHEVRLRPGDTVLLYTDGLVERRASDLDVGIRRLRDTVAELDPADPAQFVDDTIRRMLGQGTPHDDDVVVLAAHLPAADRH